MVGLRNLGNTCYLDASLQCLVHTNELTNELLANEILMKINFKAADGELVCSYIDLLKKGKYLQKKSSLAPSQFKAVFGRKYTQFSGSSQEDAHEFLNFLLNSLHDELN